MPSLFLLNCLLNQFKTRLQTTAEGTDDDHAIELDGNKTFYILNPSGDLQKTQTKFEPIFKSRNNWIGIVNRAPTHEEFISALSNHDIVLYV
jgi:hypothetical protein